MNNRSPQALASRASTLWRAFRPVIPWKLLGLLLLWMGILLFLRYYVRLLGDPNG